MQEWFQQPAGRIFLEYLLGEVDRNKDSLLDKAEPTDVDIYRMKGALMVFSDIIGLVAFLKRFKVIERK